MAAAAMLASCALPGDDDPAAESPLGASTGLPRGLGERSSPLEVDDPAASPEAEENGEEDEGQDQASGDVEDDGTSSGEAKGKKGGGGKGKGGGGGQGGGVFPPPPPGGQGTSSVRLVQISEPAGDAGRDASYADLRSMVIDETDGRAIVSVDVGGDLPSRLAEGEVMGVGVDLFLGSSQESDYQLFADGSSDGWYAYLQTPQGFVDFPGSFAVGGRRLVFDVPWSALGDPASGRVSAFADWSRRGGAINPFSEDFLPDEGARPFTR